MGCNHLNESILRALPEMTPEKLFKQAADHLIALLSSWSKNVTITGKKKARIQHARKKIH